MNRRSTILLGVAAGAFAAAAQATIPGISLVGPSAPEFLKLVTGILPDEDALAALKPALPTIFVLRNSGSRAVVYYVLRFGDQVIAADFDDPALGGKTHSFKAESYRLVSPVPGMEEVSDGMASETKNPAVYQRFLTGAKRWTGVQVSVSVDSVIFEDGQFAGPDVAGRFPALQRMSRGRRQFLDRVRSMDSASDEAVETWLESVLGEAGSDEGTAKRKELARWMLAMLQRRGRTALRISMQNIVNYPEIRK